MSAVAEERIVPETQDSTKAAFLRGAKRFLIGRSLAECIESGRDNILQLRLTAALMVILGHSYGLVFGKMTPYDPVHRILPTMFTHMVGVMTFFVVSGFLITLSWQRRPDVLRFVRARVLRLWPALVVCVTITAFVLGPILTKLSLHDYFGKGDSYGTAYAYALGNASLFKMQNFLPGVFVDVPAIRNVNSSLWTIPIEATMYVCVGCAGLLRLFRFPWLTSIAIAVLFVVFALVPLYTGHHGTGTDWFGVILAGLFGLGSIACLLRRYVPVSTGLMIAIAAVCILMRNTIHGAAFAWVLVSYFAFWFAYVPRIPTIPRDLDLSYGTYLWAFPVQQIVVELTRTQNPLVLFAIATGIVLPLAAASWLWIEKPALRLKNIASARVSAPQSA